MLSAGVPVHVVAKRVGHTNATMTLTVYAHALPNQNAATAATLAGVLYRRG
jgi:integrase